MTGPRIDVDIDRLVVHGLSADAAAALRDELVARLTVLAGAAAEAGALSSVRPRAEAGRHLELATAAVGGHLGADAADAVWSLVTGTAGGSR